MQKQPLDPLPEDEGLYRTHLLSTADQIVPILNKAAFSMGSSADDGLFTYSDFFISDVGVAGRTSKAVVGHVKSKNKAKPIHVIFGDQPERDFSQLLTKEQPSISDGFDDVFVSVIGRSYYKQCLPTDSVDLALSSFSLHRPDFETDAEFDIPPGSVPTFTQVKWKKDSKSADDYERFLVHRAHELKKNGHLVVVDYVGPSDFKNGTSASDEAFKVRVETSSFHKIYEDMQKEGRLMPTENFFVPGILRTREDYEAPFLQDSSPVRKAGLRLCSLEKFFIPCPLAQKYRDGEYSAEEVGRRMALHEKVWSESMLGRSLAPERTKEEKQQLVEEIYARLAKHITSKVPNVGLSYTVAIIIAKKE